MAIDQDHEQLERDVCSYLRSEGWIVAAALTYHEHFTDEQQKAIMYLTDGTSLCVRTRADRIAIHPGRKISVKLEPKTVKPPNKNFACELLPLMHHMLESELGAVCVYPVRFMSNMVDRGFIVGPVNELVSSVFIPQTERPKISPDTREALLSQTARMFPRARLREDLTRGSGDPFVIIPEASAAAWPHWKDLLSSKERTNERPIPQRHPDHRNDEARP